MPTPDWTSAAPVPPPSLPEAIRSGWMLRPNIHYLNHGSFGARRLRVVERQMAYRRELEAEPVAFLDRTLFERLEHARGVVGRMLGMDPAQFGFVTNATEGINAVLRDLHLAPGDRLVTTGHVYRAVGQAMHHVARMRGAEVVRVPIALPVTDPGCILSALRRAMEPGADGRPARLLIIDHVTSPSALVLPVREIIAAAREIGTPVLVDGAHAPGMLPLDVTALAPDWYVANLHKWICAPLGAAFLWASEAQVARTHAPVISHDLDEGLEREFAWQGTRDVTAWLAAADAVTEVTELLGPNGWRDVMRHNHAGARWAGALLAEAWEVESLSPPEGGMIGSMVTIPLPPQIRACFPDAPAFQRALFNEFQIEIPVMEIGGAWHVRPSYQVYNEPASYHRLAEAVQRSSSKSR